MHNSTSSAVARPHAMTTGRAKPIDDQPGGAEPSVSPTEARQGRSGRRVLTILVVSILLALIAFVTIGAFPEEWMMRDL